MYTVSRDSHTKDMEQCVMAAVVVRSREVPFPTGQPPAFPMTPLEAWTRILASAPPSWTKTLQCF